MKSQGCLLFPHNINYYAFGWLAGLHGNFDRTACAACSIFGRQLIIAGR